jgi:hypothetical protein
MAQSKYEPDELPLDEEDKKMSVMRVGIDLFQMVPVKSLST